MIKTTKEEITCCQSEKISSFSGVEHFFSTRVGGVSKGVFCSLNFGTHHGETENMLANLALLKNTHLHAEARFIIPKQTHNDVVVVVEHSNLTDSFENTDALITNLPNVVLCIKTADCVPILLFDPIKKVVGAVHSGWRGTAQNILGKTVGMMVQTYGCNPAAIVAAIGPCISQQNYEVGSEVADAIRPLLKYSEKAIAEIENTPGKFLLNLTEANSQLLLDAGIASENIDTFHSCTFSYEDEFFSARRDGNKTGRMINGIVLC
jgi:YfiH family protein